MKRAVLVVDDELSIRNFFEDTLADSGCTVHTSENADDALSVLEREDINVIFLDLKLFGMNGIELCRKIRNQKPLSVIYAMTGWSGLFEIEECREAGFDDFFSKPVSSASIEKAVEDGFEKIARWKSRHR